MKKDFSKGYSGLRKNCDEDISNTDDLKFFSVTCDDVAEEYSETISDDNLREFMESRPDNYYLD